MSRDYKDSAPGSGAAAKTNTLLLGIVVGLVLGLAIALGVAWYINKMPSPFKHLKIPPSTAELEASAPVLTAPLNQPQPHFDFYKILPGNNDTTGMPASPQTPAKPSKPATATTNNAAPAAGIYYLQVAALQNPADADSLKGKLALLGIQASIQTVATPDKGTLYRVRTGPYKTPEELDTARATLNQNNYSPTLVKGQ